jgi:hypothetical protein
MPENFDRNVDEDRMFHVTVTGFNYQAGAPIDLVFVGYSYQNGASKNLYHTSVVDRAGGTSCTNNSMSYWGSDKHLYLRFKDIAAGNSGNIYFSSFRVDSMHVGNGIVMKQGDISVFESEQPELRVVNGPSVSLLVLFMEHAWDLRLLRPRQFLSL